MSPRAQEVAMTSKQDFTDEQWTRIRRAPLVAGVAISLADPGGPIEVAKETMASLRSATLPPSQEELLASVALDIQALAQHKQNPVGEFKPRGGQQVLEELRAVNEIVQTKATPQEEVEAFRGWLVAAAQAAADAGKEGGFLGFGAERVSARERQMLDQVRAALGMA
jgi:transcription antitermination factor NusG